MTKGFRRIRFSGAHAPTSSAAPAGQPKRGGSTSARSTFRGAGPSGSHTGGGSIRPSASPPATRLDEEGDARERNDGDCEACTRSRTFSHPTDFATSEG